MTVQLRVIMERRAYRLGCGCGCCLSNLEKEEPFPERQKNRLAVGGVLRALIDRYGDKLDISIIDSRNILYLWDIIRYGARASNPVWLLDRKKFCDGLPDLAALQNAIDEKIGNAAAKMPLLSA